MDNNLKPLKPAKIERDIILNSVFRYSFLNQY